MIALVVVTDGRREYLEQMLATLNRVDGIDYRAAVDDSGDPDYAKWLDSLDFDVVLHHPHRLGLAAAAQDAWTLATRSGADHLFHVEEDFTFSERIPLPRMATLLDRRPHLAQLVLKRQPWSIEEKQAGGQIECAEAQGRTFDEKVSDLGTWVEHRHLFSFNPSLIPARVFARDWPPILEADVTETLYAEPDLRFAYWGAKNAPPLCEHIGVHRSPGYRW